MGPAETPSLMDFLDYREFLNRFLEHNRKHAVGLSLRAMARSIELDPSFLLKIIQGKASLSLKTVPRLAAHLGLQDRESDYLEALVRFARARTEKDSKHWFERMLFLQGLDSVTLEQRQYAYFRNWYHCAVRAMIGLHPFDGKSWQAFAARFHPALTEQQARESVALLEALGLIRRHPDGLYRLEDRHVTTGENWRSLAIREFQREMIKLSEASLESHPKEVRDVSSLTLAIHHEDLELMREHAATFRRNLQQMKNAKPADCVYQVNIQMYPLSVLPGAKA